MYNRYIPLSDGTYRRQRIADSATRPSPLPKKPKVPMPACEEPKDPPVPIEAPPSQCPEQPIKERNPNCRPIPSSKPSMSPFSLQESSIGHFLHQLLPKDFDTGDLLIVLLLILMAGDCSDDRNTALLTLMLYFFM